MSSDFVQIGGVRIKRSNIASFGVAEGTREQSFAESGFWKFALTHALSGLTNRKVRPRTTYTYLYVKTYQKDSYTFAENEIDISAALADLEKR